MRYFKDNLAAYGNGFEAFEMLLFKQFKQENEGGMSKEAMTYLIDGIEKIINHNKISIDLDIGRIRDEGNSNNMSILMYYMIFRYLKSFKNNCVVFVDPEENDIQTLYNHCRASPEKVTLVTDADIITSFFGHEFIDYQDNVIIDLRSKMYSLGEGHYKNLVMATIKQLHVKGKYIYIFVDNIDEKNLDFSAYELAYSFSEFYKSWVLEEHKEDEEKKKQEKKNKPKNKTKNPYI